MSRYKILVFNWRCWQNPDAGGAEVFTHEVLKRWTAKGHDVTLFASKFDGSKKQEVIDNIRVIRQGGWFSVYRHASRFYAAKLAKEKFDVVIDEINTKPFMVHNFVKNGEKVIALIHQLAREYWFYETFFPISYVGYYFLEKRWLRKYTKTPTVTVSKSTAEDLAALAFEKIFIVGEGLNFKPLKSVPQKTSNPVLVYAGRLKKAKRPNLALEAFKIVKKVLPHSEFWIIGEGPFKRKLEKNSCDGVRFFGSLSNKDRRELIKKAWVLVNPSVREGFGLNVVEANALGVPCVAYNVPGLKDSVIDGETGFLVKSGDTKALADALLLVLNNADLRAELSAKALEHSKSFSWDNVADTFLHVVETVLQEDFAKA